MVKEMVEGRKRESWRVVVGFCDDLLGFEVKRKRRCRSQRIKGLWMENYNGIIIEEGKSEYGIFMDSE